jgi:adenine phosphoribosyltransferase
VRTGKQLRGLIRDVPGFPKDGIVFRDITTLLRDAVGFREVVQLLAERYRGGGIDAVVGVEARGFILGGAVAYALGTGFVPVRKPGKLPWTTIREDYALEYGSDAVEMHADALAPGSRVVVLDDLLATGGTALATARLVERAGAMVEEIVFMIELSFLEGRSKLRDYPVFSLIQYEKE